MTSEGLGEMFKNAACVDGGDELTRKACADGERGPPSSRAEFVGPFGIFKLYYYMQELFCSLDFSLCIPYYLFIACNFMHIILLTADGTVYVLLKLALCVAARNSGSVQQETETQQFKLIFFRFNMPFPFFFNSKSKTLLQLATLN